MIKTFPTDRTRVRFYTGVNSIVNSQLVSAGKLFVTSGTFEGFLSSMTPLHVFHQVRVREALLSAKTANLLLHAENVPVSLAECHARSSALVTYVCDAMVCHHSFCGIRRDQLTITGDF